MTYCLSGGIVAAPTTSLPEVIGGNRNWDYRFCWLRDAGLTMRALVSLGYMDEAGAFLSWLLHSTRLTWPRLQVVYDVYGRTSLAERVLAHLGGHHGSRPVRIGNQASDQYQTDIYGEVIFATDAFVAGGGRLDEVEKRLILGLSDSVLKLWRRPDYGIWEIRDQPRHYTYSKLMCWVALDRLLRMEQRGALRLGAKAAEIRAARTAIADVIERRGFNDDLQSYVGELDGRGVDASLLVMACVGYRNASDAKVRATFQRIQDALGEGVLVYRYPPGADGLAGREGAFGICSFWAVEVLARQGNVAAAERRFEHLLSFANDVGLFAEEIAPKSGAALGNFPQAFTHVGLINAADAIERARNAETSATSSGDSWSLAG
jgi:GH15 family glucan-1,4-alpha-glucosidase